MNHEQQWIVKSDNIACIQEISNVLSGRLMREISKARYVLIGLTASSYAVVSLLATITDFKVDYSSFVASMSILALIAAAGGRITTRLQLTKTRALIDNYSCGLLLVIPIVIATYMSARLGMPWADDRLQSMDAALGFNWLNLVYFIDERRYLAILLNISYVTFQYQLVLLPALLTLSGSVLKSYQTIIIYAVVCYVSCVVSIWYPALGTYTVHGLDPQNYADLKQNGGNHHIPFRSCGCFSTMHVVSLGP